MALGHQDVSLVFIELGAAVVGLAPKFSTSNLFDIAPDGSAMSSDFLPFGISGVVAALVYSFISAMTSSSDSGEASGTTPKSAVISGGAPAKSA